ncbi:MAG: hypothetical protein AB2809_00875 [Candidatus Thiodiazotropha sp.]
MTVYPHIKFMALIIALVTIPVLSASGAGGETVSTHHDGQLTAQIIDDFVITMNSLAENYKDIGLSSTNTGQPNSDTGGDSEGVFWIFTRSLTKEQSSALAELIRDNNFVSVDEWAKVGDRIVAAVVDSTLTPDERRVVSLAAPVDPPISNSERSLIAKNEERLRHALGFISDDPK